MRTIQRCKKCGADVVLDAGDFLLNLDEKVYCEKCKNEKEEKLDV